MVIGRNKEKINREKIALVVKLRDEQNLTWDQIHIQTGRSFEWCRKSYFEATGNKPGLPGNPRKRISLIGLREQTPHSR